MVLSHVGRKQQEYESQFHVRLELHARSVHIWWITSEHKTEEEKEKAVARGREGIQDDIDDLQTGDTLVVRVPPELVNQVINDSCLRQLQDASGMTASVTKDDQGTGIRLVGLRGALAEAAATIEKLVAGQGADSLALFPGMMDSMSQRAWDDFNRDLSSMEQHVGVTLAR